MLTKQQITDASPTLDETDITMLVTLIRNSKRYRENAGLFGNLRAKILEANNTVRAKQLNAILALIQALGVGEVSINGGDDAISYSQSKEREAMVNYAISVLYEISDADGSIIIIDDGLIFSNGRYSIGQRTVTGGLI